MNIADIAAEKNYEYMKGGKDYDKLCSAFAKGYLKGASDKTCVMNEYFENKKSQLIEMLKYRFDGVVDISKEIEYISNI